MDKIKKIPLPATLSREWDCKQNKQTVGDQCVQACISHTHLWYSPLNVSSVCGYEKV